MQLASAGIQNFDKENLPARIAARGGLGAVMGAKKIKAIVIDAKDGQKPPIAHPDEYKASAEVIHKSVDGSSANCCLPRLWDRCDGTYELMASVDYQPVIFLLDSLKSVETISGEYMRDVILQARWRW